jgi:DNA-directed RNA polymerase delta subunit
MINLELLTEFTHEELRYKSDIKVVSYKINVNWIELQFQDVMGEVVKLEKYYNWLQSVREEKINQIL